MRSIRTGARPPLPPMLADAAALIGDDPRRLRSPLRLGLFRLYLGWYFRRHFHALRIARDGWPRLPPGRPVIVYSNHPGWWDPALYVLLAGRLFPGRPSYGPMDEAALAQYRFMRRIGVFGIVPQGHAGAARFLRVGRAVLADPRAMLWVTAEGGFRDPRGRPVTLQPGIGHLARAVPDAVLLPLAIEYGFWSERAPEALVRFGAAVATPAEVGPTERTVDLAARLEATLDALATRACGRDPAAFDRLVTGGAGVGGLYDLGRRLGAALRGRRFDPRHGREA